MIIGVNCSGLTPFLLPAPDDGLNRTPPTVTRLTLNCHPDAVKPTIQYEITLNQNMEYTIKKFSPLHYQSININ